jgi:putative two-component system response regulator
VLNPQSVFQAKSCIDEQGVSVITSLAQTIESRDSNAKGHGARVSILAVQFGKSVGIRERELDALHIGSLIHDIGKVSVPDRILLKPGPLDFEEFKILKRHPVLGEQICAPMKSLRDMLPIIRHHHERMDGSGYPDGLRGNSIPIAARVLQIVDIYDALTNDRAYRKALGVPNALAILSQEVGRGWLDSALVDQFTSLVVAAQSAKAGSRRRGSKDSQSRSSLPGAVVPAMQQRG